MATNKVMASSSKPKQRETWSRETRNNNMTKRVTVEELDNKGYLVIINIYGDKPNGKYFDNTKKYYSETNPLEPEEESPIDKIFNALVRTVK